MQPLSSVAARRPLVSGAGSRCRRWWGCCSFGGLLVLFTTLAHATDASAAAVREPPARPAVRPAVRSLAPPQRTPDPRGPKNLAPRGAVHMRPAVHDIRPAAARKRLEAEPVATVAAVAAVSREERREPDAPIAATPRPDRSEPPRESRESAPEMPPTDAMRLSLHRERFGPSSPPDGALGLPREAFDAALEPDDRAAWKPARSRWGFEHGRLAVQLDSGARLSLRARRGGLAVSLKHSF